MAYLDDRFGSHDTAFEAFAANERRRMTEESGQRRAEKRKIKEEEAERARRVATLSKLTEHEDRKEVSDGGGTVFWIVAAMLLIGWMGS